MNEDLYASFYNKVGKWNGWDFSRVKCFSEGAAWDFRDEIVRACRPDDVLLDIGTGGGERLLSLAGHARLLVGIDSSSGMMEKAADNLQASGARNVRFVPMDARKLDFPDGFFDVVVCRHSQFYAAEAARVLADGGVFLTQQVSENDKRNIAEAFGRGQFSGCEQGAMEASYAADLKSAGFTDVRTFRYDADEYYETPEDLLFLLEHTPIVPGFGRTEADYSVFRQIIADNRTEKGIRTNEARFMLIARK